MSRTRRSLAAFAVTFAAFGAALLPSSASAGVVMHAAISGVESEAVGELGLGYQFRMGQFYVAPAIGAELKAGDDEDTRYRSETQRNGTEVCRDTTNGRYSKKENCSSDMDGRGFVALEAGYRFNESTVVGVGARRVEGLTSPYAVVHIGSVGGLKFRVAGGKEYVSLGVGVGF